MIATDSGLNRGPHLLLHPIIMIIFYVDIDRMKCILILILIHYNYYYYILWYDNPRVIWCVPSIRQHVLQYTLLPFYIMYLYCLWKINIQIQIQINHYLDLLSSHDLYVNLHYCGMV